MKVFIIHYKKLLERKIHILEQFIKNDIKDYEFIEIDRDEIPDDVLPFFTDNYNKALMAIALSHFHVYKQIVENHDHVLILEDDAMLADDFTIKLNRYLAELPPDYDMFFIGNGAFLHIDPSIIEPNKHIYKKDPYPSEWGGLGATRCVDSYIVSKKGAIQMCEYIQNLKYKIKDPIDFWLNIPILEMKMNIYWAEPTIVSQGTQNGLFESSYIV
jgi:glycosyl transferase family 25